VKGASHQGQEPLDKEVKDATMLRGAVKTVTDTSLCVTAVVKRSHELLKSSINSVPSLNPIYSHAIT
jgi:hypothetical protein